AAQPLADGNVEPLLGAFKKRFRQIATEHASQRPLALAVLDLRGRWQAPSELDDPVVEKWTSPLQAGCHCRAVELYQDISRQITGHVAVNDPSDGIEGRRNVLDVSPPRIKSHRPRT